MVHGPQLRGTVAVLPGLHMLIGEAGMARMGTDTIQAAFLSEDSGQMVMPTCFSCVLWPQLGSALSDCARLSELRVNDNHLASLAGLRGLQALEVGSDEEENDDDEGDGPVVMIPSQTMITTTTMTMATTPPPPCPQKSLHVRRNHLSSLGSLPVLGSLLELYLAGNRLTSLAGLARAAPKLEVLDVTNNRLVSGHTTPRGRGGDDGVMG
jgi:hypothetical protein